MYLLRYIQSMEVKPKQVVEYQTEEGRNPFAEWHDGLRDLQARAAIRARITRVRTGNLGNCRFVGHGVMELKIYLGPGYRVYFAQDGDSIVVLLCGGDKGSQERDIRTAQDYWEDYQIRRNHGQEET